jgi:hypothetical protein
MKLYELEAGQKEALDNTIEQVVPMIQEHCQFALAGMREAKQFLYRGFKSTPSIAFLGKSREDRRPSSSAATFHRNINLAFAAAGFVANRSNSIFATSNIGDASVYAAGKNAYMIFPIDGFQFTWSPKIDDLYVYEYRLFGDDELAHTRRSMFYNYDDASPELIQEFLKKSKYTDKDFGAAVMSGNEVMIHGQYYAVTTRFKDWPEFRHSIGAV